MSSRLDLGPADLDRLEDALEDLELNDRLDAANDGAFDDDPVAQRLVEYRALLQLSREAMPLEDVPAGLLDGVLAQARQSAAAGAAAGAPVPSFWARWRLSLWVPTLAFAGSAALLLIVLVPGRSAESPTVASADAQVAKQEERSEAPSAAADRSVEPRIAMAEPEPDADADEAQRGAGLAIGERAPDPAPARAAPPADYGGAEPSKRRKAASGSSTSGSSTAGARPAPATTKPSPKPTPSVPNALPNAPGGASKGKADPMPEPVAVEDEKKSKKDDGVDLWPEINRADADRRGGGCGLAKMRYENLRKAGDSRVRARALAGLGLCEAADGSMSTAKKLFAQARAADPDVSGFIDTELARIEGARDPSPQSAE